MTTAARPLAGKIAIVAGASRGIGADIATYLARAGAGVVIAARSEQVRDPRWPATIYTVAKEIEDEGNAAFPVRLNLREPESILECVERSVQHFGRLDILVNNAAVQARGNIETMDPRYLSTMWEVNVRGPILMCRAALPHLRQAGGGHIINISSRGAIGPGPGPYNGPHAAGTAYGATKAAVERFTQGLASEVWQDGVSVNALSPHRPIWTEGGHYFRAQEGKPAYSGWRMAGDIFGDAVVTICTLPAGFFTGNILFDELVMMNQAGLAEAEIMRRYPVES